MTNYIENLRQRIIFIIIGVLCYYFAFIPILIISSYLMLGIDSIYFLTIPLRLLISIALLLYFIYRALFKVNPSLAPLIKRYKKVLLVTAIVFLILMVLLPSGIIVPEWKQGKCTISSEIIMQDGTSSHGSKSTVQGINSISQCLSHCTYHDNINLKSKRICEFKEFFDFDSIVIDSENLSKDDRIRFDGKILLNGLGI